MTDIVEVRKINKDEDWMDGVLLHIYHLLQFLQVLVINFSHCLRLFKFKVSQTNAEKPKLIDIWL